MRFGWKHGALAGAGAAIIGASALLATRALATHDPAWPAAAIQLTAPALALPPGFGVKRVYLDAGHGAEDNRGNVGALGQLEQDFTLSLAEAVRDELTRSQHFEVKLCRERGQLRAYGERVAEAAAWRADVFVSLHSDVRRPDVGGFSVLWSDDGADPLAARRLALARHLARRLAALGLPAYAGEEYEGLYAGDDTPGVFVDRHPHGERIFVLRATTMPAVIVETHNAKNAAEARRWEEPAVRLAFARALALAIADLR
jgi:N-acetylmuramoyl-L-alanine amidase